MHCYICYWHLYLPKISSEIQIFDFGYLSSRILYLYEQGCEDPWVFSEAKRCPWAKMFGKHWPSWSRTPWWRTKLLWNSDIKIYYCPCICYSIIVTVLYWCNTPSPTKRRTQAEGIQKQGIEENISTQEGEATADWRILYNEKLHDL